MCYNTKKTGISPQKSDRRIDMNPKLKNDEAITELFKAIATLENEEECAYFFEDLCSVAELKAMAQRLQVAKLLKLDLPYNKIVDMTGASTATISRVKRSFDYGEDGYMIAIKRLNK